MLKDGEDNEQTCATKGMQTLKIQSVEKNNEIQQMFNCSKFTQNNLNAFIGKS